MILLVLTACLSAEAIQEGQDAAALDAADALAASLVLAELAAHADDPPPETTLRHTGTCGCPCVDRVGAADSYVQELDYSQPSCIPWSGLLGADIGGHVWVDVDGDDLGIQRTQATVGGVDLLADVDGTWSGTPLAWASTLSGTVDIAPVALTVDELSLDRANGGLALEGGIAGGTLEGVRWAGSPGASACPTPDEGRFVRDDTEVVFSGSEAEVTFKGHTTRYDLCEIAPAWY